MSDKLSEHFLEKEFQCKCGKCDNSLVIDIDLIYRLEVMRQSIGPLTINSGYRCPKHPLTIERPGSYHAKGKAADVRFPTVNEMLHEMIKLAFGLFNGAAVNWKGGYVHVDTRLMPRTWGY